MSIALDHRSKTLEEPENARRLDVAKLVAEHHRISCQVEDLEHELLLLKSSRSWKITKPLRAARLIINYLRSYVQPGSVPLCFSQCAGAIYNSDCWEVSSRGVQLIIDSPRGRLPVGWCTFRLAEPSETTPRQFALYVDSGEGFSELSRLTLDFSNGDKVQVRLPLLVRALRVDPLRPSSRFKLVGFEAREHFALFIWWKELAALAARTAWADLPSLVFHSFKVFVRGGPLAFAQELLRQQLPPAQRNKVYRRWLKRYCSGSVQSSQKNRLLSRDFEFKPLISVLMPVYNVPDRWLREALDSVIAQDYEHWELCIADDASTRPSCKVTLEEYKARDSRIRVVYREQNGHISRTSNTALEMARGEYIALMDHDDLISKDALFHVVSTLQKNRDADLLYSDEDRVSDSGSRIDPYFKCAWNPELLLGQNLISHLGVYRTRIAREIGGFRPGFEGSQDWDFALRFTERTKPGRIIHIPKILYHWRLVPGTVSFSLDTKAQAFVAAEKCVQEHLQRMGIAAEVRRSSEAGNIINYKLIQPPSAEIFRFSNPSELLTADLANKAGEYLLFLHRDSELLDENWREELVAPAMRAGTGAVAARLIDEHGALVHAGYSPRPDGSLIPLHAGVPAGSSGYFGRAALAQEIWASELDGLLIRRDIAARLIDAKLPDCKDAGIALCLQLRKEGLRVVWCPHIRVRTSTDRVATPWVDPSLLQEKWLSDFYNPQLSRFSGDYVPDFSK